MKASVLQPKIKEGMLVRLPHLDNKIGYTYFKIDEIDLTRVFLNPVLVKMEDGLYKILTHKRYELSLSELLNDCTYLDELDEFELQLKLIPAHNI